MADIISIEERREDGRKKNKSDLLKRKQRAVQKLFRCSCCSSECEKCGAPIPSDCPRTRGHEPQSLRVPYRFCENCAEEYIDYIERLKGKGDANCYWRNEAWLEIWTAWIHYRAAMDRHFKSKEFLQLIKELKPSPSDK